MRTILLAPLLVSGFARFTMAIDPGEMWDFGNPEVSERRFRDALESATGDDVLILQTQIARTHGLRKDFETARRVLGEIEPAMANAGNEARVRYFLELGRTHASSTHGSDEMTEEARARARQAYEEALSIAREAGLDALAIDAIHMFAFLDTAPADQLKWGEAALEVALTSSQADARRWEAAIRNNLGYALHQLERYDEALVQFEKAVELRELRSDPEAVRVARWMVAWTLRSMNRFDEALKIQLELEREMNAAGKPDPYVYEELEALYKAKGDPDKAVHYAGMRASALGQDGKQP